MLFGNETVIVTINTPKIFLCGHNSKLGFNAGFIDVPAHHHRVPNPFTPKEYLIQLVSQKKTVPYYLFYKTRHLITCWGRHSPTVTRNPRNQLFQAALTIFFIGTSPLRVAKDEPYTRLTFLPRLISTTVYLGDHNRRSKSYNKSLIPALGFTDYKVITSLDSNVIRFRSQYEFSFK